MSKRKRYTGRDKAAESAAVDAYLKAARALSTGAPVPAYLTAEAAAREAHAATEVERLVQEVGAISAQCLEAQARIEALEGALRGLLDVHDDAAFAAARAALAGKDAKP